MQDPPAGQHAARRNDDHRAMLRVQLLRLLDRSDPLGDLEHRKAILPGNVMFFVMAVVDFGRVDRHWRVEINRHIWDLAAVLQACNVIHKPLRAPNRE